MATSPGEIVPYIKTFAHHVNLCEQAIDDALLQANNGNDKWIFSSSKIAAIQFEVCILAPGLTLSVQSELKKRYFLAGWYRFIIVPETNDPQTVPSGYILYTVELAAEMP